MTMTPISGPTDSRPGIKEIIMNGFIPRKIFVCVSLLALVALLAPVRVMAHKVMVFGYVEDGKVKTISKFSGGKKVQGGKIRVFDEDGRELLQGVTDENGEFTFDIPSKKGLKIELEAAMGHKNVSVIPADQLAVAGDSPVGESRSEPGGEATPEMPAAEENPADSGDRNQRNLEAAVETVLDRKVMPVLQMMAEKEDKPRVADILGGLGYIVGLVGIALYMKSRKEG